MSTVTTEMLYTVLQHTFSPVPEHRAAAEAQLRAKAARDLVLEDGMDQD